MNHYEQTGNKHWWPRDVKSRKATVKVLQKLARVLTPDQVNAALPPLPPVLWRRMRKYKPELYKDEQGRCQVAVGRVGKEEWRRFKRACKTWKVSVADATIAMLIMFTKVVESSQEVEDEPTPGQAETGVADQDQAQAEPEA